MALEHLQWDQEELFGGKTDYKKSRATVPLNTISFDSVAKEFYDQTTFRHKDMKSAWSPIKFQPTALVTFRKLQFRKLVNHEANDVEQLY